MRKVLITATSALLLAGFSIPLAAFADESDDEHTVEVLGEEEGNPVIDHLHSEIEKRFKHHSWLLIPPTVMRMGQPTDPNIYILPTLPNVEGIVTGLELSDGSKLEQVGLIDSGTSSTLNPYEHAAIPIDSVNISTATPTDEFIDGARVFGVALALAAVGLSAVTGVNTVRSRRRKLRYLKASGQ